MVYELAVAAREWLEAPLPPNAQQLPPPFDRPPAAAGVEAEAGPVSGAAAAAEAILHSGPLGEGGRAAAQRAQQGRQRQRRALPSAEEVAAESARLLRQQQQWEVGAAWGCDELDSCQHG